MYATRKHGPGKCRHGHDKDYAGDCRVCLQVRAARRREARRRQQSRDVITLEQIDNDVSAMRQRVAERAARQQARTALVPTRRA